jgi:RNA polymerase sigma factor (sigma-70 family)
MNVYDEFNACDLDPIIDRMVSYAYYRLNNEGIKDFDGKDPLDFVSDIFLKVLEGKRDWNNAKCPFVEFLFGCLKSDISNFFKTIKRKIDDIEIENFPDNNFESIEEQKKLIVQMLIDENADDEELIVFDYWTDGITKPNLIAKDLGISEKDVYNIIRRLDRKIKKIQLKAIKVL